MSWLNWLENRVGFLAIPRLIPAIALLNLFVYILFQFQPEYVSFLTLEPALVLRRRSLWRLVSTSSYRSTFRDNHGGFYSAVRFLSAVRLVHDLGRKLAGTSLGCVSFNALLRAGNGGRNHRCLFLLGAGQSEGNVLPLYINLSLFFAFATIFPNVQIYVFFVIPVKIKWVALISVVPTLLAFVYSPLVGKTAIVISLLNYILFFAPMAVSNARHNRHVQKRRLKFAAGVGARSMSPLHRCAVCKTDRTR